MGRRNHGDKELTQLQTIKKENDKLKREIGSLRKQLARIDLDRYSSAKMIIDEHYFNKEQDESTQEMLLSLKNKWKCNKCTSGYLEIVLYSKMGETWYFRTCHDECGNRTESKQYTPDVKGIMKETKEVVTPDNKRKKLTFK